MRPYHAALIILTTAGILAAAGPARKPKTQFLNPQGVPKPTGYTQVVSAGPRPNDLHFRSGRSCTRWTNAGRLRGANQEHL